MLRGPVTTFYNSVGPSSVESQLDADTTYVAKRNQQILVEKKVADTGVDRRGSAAVGVDLLAVSITCRAPVQNQRRIEGQHAAGINPR